MRPLRVGLVCPYSFDVPGGVQSHVRDLASTLLARGHTVRVLAPGEPTDALPEHVTVSGRAVPVRFNGAVARLAFGPRAVAAVRRWLADGAFDIVHVHEPAAPSLSLLTVWASDVPVVATFHYAGERSRLVSSTVALLRPSMERIGARIAVSEAARDTLVAHLGGEPIVVPNGVDCAAFEVAARPELTGPGPVIGFLGRIDEPRKGVQVLLDALPAMIARRPDLRVVVAGAGDADRVVDALAADRTLAAHVRMAGRLSDPDRAALLSSVDVFVAPNLGGESFGIVLVEAMAAGACVVASDLPAFRDVLGDGRCGVLVPVGDPDALASAVVDLLDEPERRRALGNRARSAARGYDWSVLVPQIEAVYATVAPATGRAEVRRGPDR